MSPTQKQQSTEHDVPPLSLLADLMSREQLAQELGLTADTLSRWEARRIGPPCTRIGRKVMYRRASVEVWLGAQEKSHPISKSRGRA
jgi:transcriptional regulator with XRE-family HTH domain